MICSCFARILCSVALQSVVTSRPSCNKLAAAIKALVWYCKYVTFWADWMSDIVQVGGARVQFACASALAMLVEGHGEVCPLVLRHGGVASLATMLHTAGAQGKKAAAEAIQACSSSSAPFRDWLLCKQQYRLRDAETSV